MVNNSFVSLHQHLHKLVAYKQANGFDTTGLDAEIERLPDSFDDAIRFVARLREVPYRADWAYSEPDELADIHAESAVDRSLTLLPAILPEDIPQRIETAFLASICGCILGKPLEFNRTLPEIKELLSTIGDWPLSDYVSERLEPEVIKVRGESMAYWNKTYREQIRFVMPDDDLNYLVLGMLLLEAQGTKLQTQDVRHAWGNHLPSMVTFGPERVTVGQIAFDWDYNSLPFYKDLLSLVDGGDYRGEEHCGAQIRAHAYGYACPGNPALAADLAYQDAILTHIGTGLYSTMWTAAAIAVAFTAPEDPLDIFRVANQYIPQRSRFHEAMTVALELVEQSTDWQSGYEAIHSRLGNGISGSHCCVYEESATLINTLKYARRVDDGICLQVMQGNDTDSYGATAGSLLGAYLGAATLDKDRWVAPFQDTLHTGLAWFYELSLTAVARRMSDLPRRLASGPVTGSTIEPYESQASA